MGLFLNGPVEAWLAIFIASIIGVFIGLIMMIKKAKTLSMKLPYGPMLMAGLIISYLFSSSLIDWYSKTFYSYNRGNFYKAYGILKTMGSSKKATRF